MKKRLRIIEGIALSMVIVLDIILINHSVDIKNSLSEKDNRSTANYLVIEEKKEETKQEEVQEEIKEVVQPDPIVYDGMTLNELSDKLNKSLNSTLAGKGNVIASKCIELGVDPYIATAIILQETGCKWTCSRMVRECNNVGGQKGSGCGSYSYFPTIDEGIDAFVTNLYRNYILYGLTTPESMNTKYAADTQWAARINSYIEQIKAQ